MDAGLNHVMNTADSETLVGKLRAMQEEVQEAGEQGKMGEGLVVKLSGMMGDAFNCCENLETAAITNGAHDLAIGTILMSPNAVSYPRFTEMLSDKAFCLTIAQYKAETERILRGQPSEGPELNEAEVARLERWGVTLVDSAMLAWVQHFTGRANSLHFAVWDINVNEIPRKFQSMVCNLISMRLNLWPHIKWWLDRWGITGAKIFPLAFWEDEYLNECMVIEPRLIPYVANASDFDINMLARRGPVLRSQGSRSVGAMDNLPLNERALLLGGIAIVQEKYNGVFTKQYPPTPWRAMNFKYPRAEMPNIAEVIGNPFE